MYFLVGWCLPFKVLNIRIKKRARGRIVAQVQENGRDRGRRGNVVRRFSITADFSLILSQAYSWIYFLDFIDTSIWFVFSLKEFTSKRLVKTFCFPAKKLKNGYLYHACSGCLMFTSLQHLFENGWIFPPKDLEKNTGAQNTHAPFFFFFKLWYFMLSNKSYFVLSGLLFICSINKLNKTDFFVVFYFLFIVSSKAIQHTKTTIVFHFNKFIQLKIF